METPTDWANSRVLARRAGMVRWKGRALRGRRLEEREVPDMRFSLGLCKGKAEFRGYVLTNQGESQVQFWLEF